MKKGIKVVIENKLYHISDADYSKALALLCKGDDKYNDHLDYIRKKYDIIEDADFLNYI